MKRAILKIDAVGSKRFVAVQGPGNEARRRLLDALLAGVREHFPGGDSLYPRGVIYSSQGDCVFLVGTEPDPIVASAVRFLSAWYVAKAELPDCRAVAAYSDVEEIDLLGRIELVSAGFEQISVMEKAAHEGQLLVTDETRLGLAASYGNYVEPESARLSETGLVKYSRLSYPDPRLAEGPRIFDADQVDGLDDATLQEILARLDVDLIATALHGLSPTMHDRFERCLAHDRARQLAESPVTATGASLEEVQRSHAIVAKVATEVVRERLRKERAGVQ